MNASTRPHGRAQIQNIFNEAHEMTLLAKQTTIALMGRRKMLDLGPVRRSVCKFPREVAQFARTDWCRVPDGQHKASLYTHAYQSPSTLSILPFG